jgi:phage terminase small subunit
MALTERQKRFAFEYVKDFNATKAYIRAGYSEQGAENSAYRLLDNSGVLEEIEEWKEINSCQARLTPAFVLKIWMDIATADPRDLVSVKVAGCPACWPEELRGLCTDPNPQCKTCSGGGVRQVIVTDTGKLKGPAKRLYAGAVQTKDGIKVLMRDQGEAVLNLAKYLGMVNGVQLSGPGGGPITLQAMDDPKQLSEAQLLQIANLGVDPGVHQTREPLTLEGSTS